MSFPEGPEQLEQEKELAAQAALRWVRSGMTVGLGSGTTAKHFIRTLGRALRERERGEALKIEAVASSAESEAAATAAGIPLTAPRSGMRLDLNVDGADEITPGLDLLKGRGGALLREKILAQASRYFLVIADSSKQVQRLGRLPVPVEVTPFALPWVADRIAEMGGKAALRMAGATPGEPYCTDQRNYILDCHFEQMENPESVGTRLEKIAGVVEHGLFLGCAQAALIAEGGELSVLLPGCAPIPLAEYPIPF